MFSKKNDKNLRISQIHHKRKEESSKIKNESDVECEKSIFKKILAIGSIVLVIVLSTPIISTATIQETGTWAYGGLLKISPMELYNNVDGASYAERTSGTLKQYIYYKSDGSFGWEWNRPNPTTVNGYAVPIYPEVTLDSYSTYLPIRLQDISSLSAELDYKYVNPPTGGYNLAYDIFFSDGGTKAEVMIWINGNSRPGIYGGIFNDGYNEYDLYYTNPSTSRPWSYYAFILKNQEALNHKVDIKALLDALVRSGKLNTGWSIPFLDLGSEIFVGSGRIEISKYIVNMNGRYIIPSIQLNVVPGRESGDVNDDGRITAADALLYLRYSVGQNIYPYHMSTSDDVTCDGAIHADDALKVLRKAVGQYVSLECS